MKLWLDKYVETIRKYTDAPTAFFKASAYWCAGAALGNLVWTPWGTSKITPNLYIIIVADSARYHKSTVKNFAVNVLRNSMDTKHMLPGKGSTEGFVEALISAEHGYIFFDELKGWIDNSKREYAMGADSLIMQLHEVGPKDLIRTKGGGFIKISDNSIISFLACTTEQWFIPELQEEDVLSGKVGRFMLVPASGQELEYPVPFDMEPTEITALASELKKVVQNAPKGRYQRSESANETMKTIYYDVQRKAKQSGNPDYQAILHRVQPSAMKLGLIRAALRGSTIIENYDIENEDVLGILKGWIDCAEEVVQSTSSGQDLWQKSRIRAERFLSKQAGRLVSKRELQMFLKLDGKEVMKIMSYFEETGQAILSNSPRGSLLIFYKGRLQNNGQQEPT